MKYIIFQDPSGLWVPILFPETQTHRYIRELFPYRSFSTYSAGTCTIGVTQERKPFFSCVSKSVSLNIAFNADQSVNDEEILTILIKL